MRWDRLWRTRRSSGAKYLFWLGALSTATARVGWRYLRVGGGRLAGEVALVTGGSRGLGLLLARDLAQEGCKIAICARDPGELERARRYLEGHGADVLCIPCDVTKRNDVEAMVGQIIAHWGSVDVLVNNAGVIQVGPLESMTVADFEHAMAVNFWGTVYATLAALPGMRQRRRGRIVNITSIGGKVAMPHLLPYDCAKFAALGFSEGLRAELSREGISVTTVVPGLMRTGSFVHALFKGRQTSEYGWFKRTSASAVTSMDASRAARSIVEAAQRRKAEVCLGWQANILRVVQGLFPALTARVLATVNRMLPASSANRHVARGGQLEHGRVAAPGQEPVPAPAH